MFFFFALLYLRKPFKHDKITAVHDVALEAYWCILKWTSKSL